MADPEPGSHQLTNGKDMRRARCLETDTSGSVGGPGKPTGSNPGRAPRSDPTNLCEAALSEVKAHSACWAPVLDAPIYDGPRARTTLERWNQVHHLLCQGVGLLECARRLQLALNTVKRYARADQPERMLRVPKYRAGLVDPYREHLRKRRAKDPGVGVKHLFDQIKALGYPGCLNLLHKYINQGRADADRSHICPRRLARMLLSRPDNLKPEHRDLLTQLTTACPEMTHLATAVEGFAELLTP